MSAKPIRIAGGGFAGLTLGICLRQKGVPVLVSEAGHYPRHRVCGEFLSGTGQELLGKLMLRDSFIAAGARVARTGRFSIGSVDGPVRVLPTPAICLSRYVADALLAEIFRSLGGELLEGTRVSETDSSAEGVVLANGRRLCAHNQGLRWFGLKVHARNVDMAADLEMHSFRQGYVGVCRIEADQANICGLFRRGPGWNLSNSWRELLRGPPDSSLRRSLTNAVLEESSFCSVAGLSMATLRAADAGGCRIGDAITMIPPVTGNGMSMALESSCIAAASLTAYSRGEMSWDQARREIASACDRRFARRLAWARWLQQMMFSHFLRGAAGRLALKSGLLWKILFSNTR